MIVLFYYTKRSFRSGCCITDITNFIVSQSDADGDA